MFRAVLISAVSAVLAATTQAAAPRPNIIFVLTDDLGWGDLGVFYQNSRSFSVNRNLPAMITPALDTMAAQGLRMDRHYCPSPVCAPSRASLLLGVHQGHANVRDNQFDKELADKHTLGTVLRQAGYATAAIGKWGLGGGSGFPGHPQNRGFDYYFGYMNHGAAHYHYPKEQGAAYYENFTNISANLDKCYSTDLATARAKKWIVDHHSATPARPFFLYLAYTAPHAQLNVPSVAYPSGGGLSGGVQWNGTPGAMINTATGEIDTWIHPDYANATWDHDNNPSTAEQAWPDYAKRHATMIRRVDDAMADLIQLLKDLDIDQNTVVVFTSDNGPHNESGANGSYVQDPRFFRSYGPLDGVKRDAWEGGIRVPAIVRWPAGIPAGRVSSHPSQFQDWMNTFAELAGVPAPFASDGVSLVPDLTGNGTQRDGLIYVEYQNGGDAKTPNYADFDPSHVTTRGHMQAIFINGYKGVRYNTTTADTPFRVYQIASDPQESTNLAGQAGVPTQAEIKATIASSRRAGGGVTRVYDTVRIPPLTVAPVTVGLNYAVHEAAYPWVPDFQGETATSTGKTSVPDPGVRTRDDDIGLDFSGYLKVPTSGDYTFFLTADTGAFVRLHDARLIDADFGYTAGSDSSSGTVPLEAGLHPIRIHYRHGAASTHTLSLRWQGPGIGKQEIPASQYFIEGNPDPSIPTANPDQAFTTTTSPVVIPVLANDSDDGTPAPISIQSVTAPAAGVAQIAGSQISYTAPAGFLGTDMFSYTITDGASTATAVVTVDVLPETGLIWLPLDEASGTSAADALGRPAGLLQNFANPPAWSAGRLGNSLAFDGVDDHVVLTGNKGVTGTAARTVSFWMNAAATQSAGFRPTMISWGNVNGTNAGTRFDINLNQSSGYKLRAEFNSSGVNFTTPARSDLRNAGWVHCAIVVPAGAKVSQVLAYLDGVLATATIDPSGSGTTSINTTSLNDVTLGRISDATTGRYFTGQLDDIRIYPRALTATEITALAVQTSAENHAAAWNFRFSGNEQPVAADWNSDEDQDGISKLLEYALGGNPTLASQAIMPRLIEVAAFVFNRRQSGLPVSAYTVEYSTSLAAGSWSVLGGGSVSPHPTLAGFDEVTVAAPATSEERGFFV